jgi:hypothetical protein
MYGLGIMLTFVALGMSLAIIFGASGWAFSFYSFQRA